MANYEQSIRRTLTFEGIKYTNHPSDRGGKTKFGITHKTLKRYNSDMCTDYNIESLTLDIAMKIYRKYYWDPLNLNHIRTQAVADEIFDTAVNMGVKISAEFVQEACNLVGRIPLKVDGQIGPITINAIDQINSVILLKVLNGLQFERYKKIIKWHPGQKIFFKGWMKRI